MNCDYRKLRGRIKEKYETQNNFAEKLGIGRVSLSAKLTGRNDFSQSEIYKSSKLLEIEEEDISKYFFTPKV
mgnify:CR=1 FL=1